MTREQKIREFESIYTCTVKQDLGKYLIVEKEGYDYKISFNNRKRIKWNIALMTDESYLKFINNTKFKDSVLEAVEVISKLKVKIINKETLKFNTVYKSAIDINSLLHITSKHLLYLKQIKESLGSFYDYSKTNPVDTTSEVIITCPVHGDFKVSVNNAIFLHSGCPECAKLRRKFGRNGFINLCTQNKSTGKLYLMELYDSKEAFYKIGITQRGIKERERLIPYKTKIIKLIEGEPGKIWDKELELHKKLSQYKYTPIKTFAGRGECYIKTKEILEFVK